MNSRPQLPPTPGLRAGSCPDQVSKRYADGVGKTNKGIEERGPVPLLDLADGRDADPRA